MRLLPLNAFPVLAAPRPTGNSSTQHAPAEVGAAPPSGRAQHDAPGHGRGAAHRGPEPRLLRPVLHLQPAAVHQPAAGAADATLPVTGKHNTTWYCSVYSITGCLSDTVWRELSQSALFGRGEIC